MLLLQLCLWLVGLQAVLAVIYTPQFDRVYGVNEGEKYNLEKRKIGPRTSSHTAAKQPGHTREDSARTALSGHASEKSENTKEDSKKTASSSHAPKKPGKTKGHPTKTDSSSHTSKKSGNTKEDSTETHLDGPTQSDWAVWDRFEAIYRNKDKVTTLHWSIPFPGTRPYFPIPGNDSKYKKKAKALGRKAPSPKVANSKVLHARAGGSDPLPVFPVPGISLGNTEPVPGNGQGPPDPSDVLSPTPLNPDIPSVQELVDWLDTTYPNGLGHYLHPNVDIRQRLMFWSGGPEDLPPGQTVAGQARTAARGQGLVVLADLFMGNWRIGVSTPWSKFVRKDSKKGEPKKTWVDIRPMWRRMGMAMAIWARGPVTFRAYDDDAATRADSTWNMIERPELERRGITIRWVDRDMNARQPIYPVGHPNAHTNPPINPPNGTDPPLSQAQQEKHHIAEAKHPKVPPKAHHTKAKKAKHSRRSTAQAILRRDRMLRRLSAHHLEHRAREEKLAIVRRAVERVRAVAARNRAAVEMYY